MVAIFGVINRVPATAHSVFCHSAVAHILTPSVNLAFRPKSRYKNKCRARTGFGLMISGRVGFKLQNEALLQPCVGMYSGGNKGRLKRRILYSPTVKID